MAAVVLETIARVILRDAMDPSRETTVTAKRFDRFEHSDEHFLREILGFCGVAYHAQELPEHSGLMQAHKLVERAFVALA